METLRNNLIRDIGKVLELAKPLLNDEQFNKLKADLVANAEGTLHAVANKEARKLNEIIK